MAKEPNIFSVSKLNNYIEGLFEQEFLFKNVYVRGEVGTLRPWDHGIVFANLKENNSVLQCMLTSKCMAEAGFEIKNGMTITLVGEIVAVPKSSSYRLKAYKVINEKKTGDAEEKLIQLKKELKEAGMFDPQYKLPIPKRVKVLGFVTSQTGAVINDVIEVAKRRDPSIQVVLYPSKVSGDNATQGIIEGIHRLEEYGAEVIIVGRGGGSSEDLWVYNNREIAEAVFNCTVPVISAVGHSIDYTVLDLVADARAVTPSEAAELAVCDIRVIYERIQNCQNRLSVQIFSKIRLQKTMIQAVRNRMLSYDPRLRIEKKRMHLDSLSEKLDAKMEDKLKRKRHELSLYIERMRGLSPLDKLSQGYAYVSYEGKTLKSIEQVNKDDVIDVFVKDGMVRASVIETKGNKNE